MKQKAIEIIEDWFDMATIASMPPAEDLYNRLFPLMRLEFPRKEFEKLLMRFNGMDTASAWLDDCEALWVGGNQPSGGGNEGDNLPGGKGGDDFSDMRKGGERREHKERRGHHYHEDGTHIITYEARHYNGMVFLPNRRSGKGRRGQNE